MGNKFVVIIILFSCFLCSCHTDNRTIDIFSHQISDYNEKSDILNRYLINQSGLLDAEYYVSYQDNSTGLLAGPSDYFMKLALKVVPDSMDQWIDGLDSSEITISNELWDDLKLDSSWNFTSIPDYYYSNSNDEIKLVYKKDSIVLAIYASDPTRLSYIIK